MNPIILSILNLFSGQTGNMNFDTTMIFNKITELQNSIGTLSINDGPSVMAINFSQKALMAITFLSLMGWSDGPSNF